MTRVRARRLAGLAILLLMTQAAAAAELPPRVDILVDASSATWTPFFREGTVRIDAVRRALVHVLDRMPADGSEGEVVVWLLGAQTPWWADGACDDLSRVESGEGVDHVSIASALSTVTPGGARPLDQAVLAVLSAPVEPGRRRRLALLIAGTDTCGGDDAAVGARVADLGEALELRVVGLGLNPQLAQALAGAAPTRNATNPGELAAALEWAIRGEDAPPRKRVQLDITLPSPPPDGATVDLYGPGKDAPEALRPEGTLLRTKIEPGRYALRVVTANGGPVVEYGGIDVLQGTGTELRLPAPADPPPSLEVIPPDPVAGDTVWLVPWGEAVHRSLRASLAVPGSPPDSYVITRPVGDGHTGVELDVPDDPRVLEARLLQTSADGVVVVVARTLITPVPVFGQLEVPDKVETGTPFEVSWDGPVATGDHVLLEPADPSQIVSSACMPVGRTGPVTLVAGHEPGAFQVVYLSGLTRKSVTKRSIELYEVLARLDAPDTVTAGVPFEVRWEGPGKPDDFLTITAPDAPDATYQQWTPLVGPSPATIAAPSAAGDWELRYVATDGTVLARRPVVVEDREVRLAVPASVLAGTRLEIVWSGPDGPGDLIAVAPVGAPARRMLDWAMTSSGSPAALAAPFDPGHFEIRYIRGTDREVIARQPLDVR